MKLDRDRAVLIVVDVQEKLMPVIDRRADVERNIERLIRGFHTLGIPQLVTEQYVKGLGPTVDTVRTALEETVGYTPIEKSCFSAEGCAAFSAQLRAMQRSQIVIAGVETHVCVYQTARDLLAAGFTVAIVADAVSSRTGENRNIALTRLSAEGAIITSTEMALFEFLVESGTDEFRAIARLVK